MPGCEITLQLKFLLTFHFIIRLIFSHFAALQWGPNTVF